MYVSVDSFVQQIPICSRNIKIIWIMHLPTWTQNQREILKKRTENLDGHYGKGHAILFSVSSFLACRKNII